MKIIGTLSGGAFIVSASADELAKVMGYESSYHVKDKGNDPRVGLEIQVSKLWSIVQLERSRPDAVKDLSTKLRKLADKIDDASATLAQPAIIEVSP